MLTCGWCGGRFKKRSAKGPVPKYCSAAHRQKAFRARHGTNQSLRHAVKERAAKRGMTYNEAVNQALEGWLNPSRYADL